MSPSPFAAVAAATTAATTASVHNSHTIRINAPADTALMFFTPEGESHWVPGWAPRYLNSADGRTREGLVFTTGEGDGEFSIWLVARFDRAARLAQYVRTTPASRTGTVDIACTPAGDAADACDVTVTYALTALTPAGIASLDAYRSAAFVEMIEDWAKRVHDRLPDLLRAGIGAR